METLKFEFTREELTLIVNALGELPAKLSRDVLNKIEIEVVEQCKPPKKDEDAK